MNPTGSSENTMKSQNHAPTERCQTDPAKAFEEARSRF